MTTAYQLVFNLADQSVLPGPWILIPVVLTGVGALLVFRPALMQVIMPGGLQGTPRRLFSWFFFLFAGFMTLVVLISTIGASSRLRSDQRRGHASITEGCLQGFHPMPASGHDTERLRINGLQFAYSDYIITPGFHQTESHGGPVHADSRLRLTYIGPDIVKLEVADHACPAASDTL
jgi:hypothetical protein